MRYSVLTYNIGGYEIIHEIPEAALNPEIEFVYVTDDHSITSSTWTVVYADDLEGSNFDKCFQVRYNPFRYVHGDICMKIDGSMVPAKDLMPIFKMFEDGGYDASVMIHPSRSTMVPEYEAWVRQRCYSVEDANRWLNYFVSTGYDLNYNGLYQYNFMIQRNDNFNLEWNERTFELLKQFPSKGQTIERLDQTVGSYVLNHYYSDKKIMPVGQYITEGMYFWWYVHGTESPMLGGNAGQITPYLFNKSVYFAPLW